MNKEYTLKEDALYYVKTKDGFNDGFKTIMICRQKGRDYCFEDLCSLYWKTSEVEVLEEVPSYDEYHMMKQGKNYEKWMGKLCKFWNKENDDVIYGPLGGYSYTDPTVFECTTYSAGGFKFCEPVSKDEVSFVEDEDE